MVENLRAARSVSTIGSSVSSSQSHEFVALQQHTTHLTKKYEQLSTDYEQLHRWVVRVGLLFSCMVPGTTTLLLLLLQRHHCSSLIFICTNKIVMNIWILLI